MKATAQQSLPPRIARYELKYMIPAEWIDPISAFAAVYCSLDEYSQNSKDGFYGVNNLYLDSPGLLFLRQRLENAPDRFNMRIRSYGEGFGPGCFLEIKRKTHQVIRKYRAYVPDAGRLPWVRGRNAPSPDASVHVAEAENRELFFRLVTTYDAAPKVLTQYRRMAWISEVDEYARLTFDVSLRYMPECSCNVFPREKEMTACDPETVFDPGCSVILELKCTAPRVPVWMVDLIRNFQLHQCGFSKYAVGMEGALQNIRYDRGDRCPAYPQ